MEPGVSEKGEADHQKRRPTTAARACVYRIDAIRGRRTVQCSDGNQADLTSEVRLEHTARCRRQGAPEEHARNNVTTQREAAGVIATEREACELVGAGIAGCLEVAVDVQLCAAWGCVVRLVMAVAAPAPAEATW